MRRIYDTFTDTDAVLLQNHAPDIDLVGGGWLVPIAGVWDILNNQAKSTAVANARIGIDSGIYDGRFKADLMVGLATAAAYHIFRSNALMTNFWMVGLDDAVAQMVNLYSSTGLAFTLAAQKAFAQDEATAYEVKALCQGDEIKVYVDDVLMISHTSALYNTQTVIGLYASGNADARFDDFIAEDRPTCLYCTTGDVKLDFGEQWTSGLKYDALLEELIEAASRLIDRELHWGDCHYAADDLADQTRYFDSEAGLELRIPHCISITSLGVDQDADGVYEEAWVQGTDYVVWPYDEASFSRIDVREGTTRAFPTGQRRVEIVGKFGGFTVPPQEIKQACIITVARSFKRGMQAYQDTGALPELGELVYTMALDPDVKEILRVTARRIPYG